MNREAYTRCPDCKRKRVTMRFGSEGDYYRCDHCDWWVWVPPPEDETAWWFNEHDLATYNAWVKLNE